MGRNSSRLLIVLLLGVGAVLLFSRWQVAQERRKRVAAELQAGLRASEVLSATFARESSLRVATLTGAVRSQGTCASANVFTDTQQTVAPYSVAYSVDLGRFDRRGLRWDARDRVMFVELPGVLAEPPALDMAAARSAQTGIFISRACGIAMQQQVAGRLVAAAADKAHSPAYLAQAREAARTAVTRLVAAPLAAAGLGRVEVRVRFATDPRPQDDRRWDVSRSIEEVLADPSLNV